MASDADGPRFVGAGELTDLALLPGRFDAFASEVRSALEMLVGRIEPKLDRLSDLIRDHGDRLTSIERRQNSTDARLDALEARRPKPRTRKKRTP